MTPPDSGGRRFAAAGQAEFLAAWCGGTAYTDDFGTPRIRLPGGLEVMPGDWIIRRSGGTCQVDQK